MLKADLHIHTGEDPKDGYIMHSAKQLIDHAAKLGYKVIAITNHTAVTTTKAHIEYAKSKGMLLISAGELEIMGKEVLVYNITKDQASTIHSLDDLRKFKKNHNIYVIAPHPFFMMSKCIGRGLYKNKDLFDAVEYSWYYTREVNRNKAGVKAAHRLKKPIVMTSDMHHLSQMGRGYITIDAKIDLNNHEKSITRVFDAIRKMNFETYTKPTSYYEFFKVSSLSVFPRPIRNRMYAFIYRFIE
ncbi:PHP domain-containing protein [Candidatus Woesearchaeota archaeon]|nr:PHP domain-containing protein [Candidatus Woesearchaeota archaeon]